MKTAYRFVLARMGEVSTYRGLALALTGLGLYVSPELAAAITSIGLGIAGLIGVLVPDPAPAGE